MTVVDLDCGFIRMRGPSLPTVEFRFGPENMRFDPDKDGRRILEAAGMQGKKLQSFNEAWTLGLPGKLYHHARLYLFHLQKSQGLVAMLFSESPPPGIVKALITSLHWLPGNVWRSWSCYDMRFETPPDFTLVKARFKPGRFTLSFSHGSGKLIYDRLAPANVLLSGSSLPSWCRHNLLHGTAKDATIIPRSDTEVDLHQKGSLFSRTLPWLPGFRRSMRGRVLHDPENNKLLIVTTQGSSMTDATFARLVDSYAAIPTL